MTTLSVTGESDGLRVVVHRGVGAALLGFDLDQAKTPHLAGFTVVRKSPSGTSFTLLNRLSFDGPVTSQTTPPKRRWTSSVDAPFQKFWWVDVPPDVEAGEYEYTVTARYFTGAGNTLTDGPSVTVAAPLTIGEFANFQLGFTRGYLSSQAYVDHFHDANGAPLDYRARPKTLDYSTAPYEAQYKWLGFSGRKLVFDFLDECVADPTCSVDVFAYDLDEPDVIAGLEKLGSRLRAFLDNASLHTKASALEPEAKKRLVASAGAANIKSGHFARYAHCKVFIKKDATGNAVKVLAGSANFSVRGLYAQANNVFVYDDATVAGLYEDAFTQAFTKPQTQFAASTIAATWHDVHATGIPDSSFCFSPHQSADLSLGPIGAAITAATTTSVLYAVMELGTGALTAALKGLPARKGVFSYGVIDTGSSSVVYTPGAPNGAIIPYAYLKKQVPWPFVQEFGRDAGDATVGAIIHDKFVVVDFNGAKPRVYFGSSNLAKGGEEDNGDNLVTTADPAVVSAFAVEAVRLIDHFQFRAAMQSATKADPLILSHGDWWAPYYDATKLKLLERETFAR